ncbi:Type III secretion outermembrane pore forming protein (YscC,MxiD,HrcC, InvG) [Pseudomonas orientalis]|uniref:type III secretion system outer membrane ring subunit SctC n=1 Tax=Pseudomonas orientalis TaxID=76758 RepID=UPI000F58DF32|nr:type III secretion system outer membrane ring subunit SctC [Pseudomonas orientalis]AZE82135.1 Type III secretion outermembrane pore forming protein (YscC,MxiD,HrcC, InvG) [Pseudomonas orientalis]
MYIKPTKRSRLRLDSHGVLSRRHLWSTIGLICTLLIPVKSALAAIPSEWKNTAYAYEAEHKPLREVLEDFAQTFGTQLQIEGLLDGDVNGKIRANTPQSMLDRLGVEHRFQWFLYNNTLYISALDQQESARLEVSSETIADLKQALTDIGLFDSRFGWGELPEDGVVLVSGPKRYIEQIKQFSSQRRSPDEKQSVLSYPLKFANAADRHVDYRGEKLTINGVATILRQLLEPRSSLSALNQRPASQPAPLTPNVPRLGNPLLGQMLGANGAPAQLDTGPTLTSRAPLSNSRIRVEADVRNNAVLIYDSPERQGMYRELITQLDVARKLIEIDAIILDIERTQLREFGVNWGFQNSRFRGGVNMAPGSSSQLSIENRDRFYADIRALEAKGLATMVSNPSVLTLENQPAVIDFNRTQYLTPGRNYATILPVTVGTSLQVVPRVTTSRGVHQLHLAVDIEDGNFDENNPDRNPDRLDVRRGKVSTQAVIQEKRSLVVGGFHVTESADKQNKIPVLGDIPLLGKALFSSTERKNNRRERLFILTPRVIGDQDDPSRYLPQADQAELQAALTPLARRYSPHEPVIKRSDIIGTLARLVSGEVPKAFKAAPMPLGLNTLCSTRDLLALNTERSQWFAGPEYNVAVVVLRNQFKRNVRIDEKECSNSQTLAVTVWPHAWLKPGEEAEVFIAMRPVVKDEHLSVPRPSLITPAQKATP